MPGIPKIKICGITNEEDAKRLLNYKVDALGFIVTKRDITSRIDLELATKIISELPSKILSVVGVGEYKVEEIIEICRESGTCAVQLQRDGSVEDIGKIREILPELKIWKVIYTDSRHNIGELLEFEEVSDAILIHSKEEQWDIGVKIAKYLQKPFVLAGGLHTGNIQKAIKLFNPWMVDLISGVETVPGKKDFTKVEEFISVIRN